MTVDLHQQPGPKTKRPNDMSIQSFPQTRLDLPGDDDIERLTIPQLGIPKAIRYQHPPQLVQAFF